MNSEGKLSRSKNGITFQSCCNPTKATFRFTALFLIALLTFGSFFCFDTPGSLQDYFEINLQMSTQKFALLCAIHAWPNFIMCFIGGFLLDSVFGIRWGTVIYIGLTIIGQLIFAAGAYINAFWLMIIGRLIFGTGAESVITAQNNYSALWFKGKELNLSFGLQMTFGGVGSTVSFLINESVYNYVFKSFGYEGPKRIGVVLFISTLTCVLSIFAALILAFMDCHAEKALRRNEHQESKNVRLADVKHFKLNFWFAVLLCVTVDISIISFLSIVKIYFEKKYQFQRAMANTASSLIYSIPALTSPFFGIFVDKIGNNIFWITASVSGALLAHGLLAFTYVSPYVCMSVLGLSFSLFASSFWPFIALIVPEQQLGTAYGTSGALINFGIGLSSVASGTIVDNYGYFILEIFYIVTLIISLGAAATIWFLELYTKGDYSINGLLSNKTNH